jgi:hypothetical protein
MPSRRDGDIPGQSEDGVDRCQSQEAECLVVDLHLTEPYCLHATGAFRMVPFSSDKEQSNESAGAIETDCVE